MATLPDGTTVSLRTSEPWDLNPPGKREINASPPGDLIAGGKATITGDVTGDNDQGVSGAQVDIEIVDPEGKTTQYEVVTDGAGGFSVETEKLDTPGDYQAVTTTPGLSKAIVEPWGVYPPTFETRIITEGWNISPPTFGTERFSEGWNN